MTHDTTSPIKPYSECDRDELLDILKLRDSVIRILESELKVLAVQLEAIGAGGVSGERIMGPANSALLEERDRLLDALKAMHRFLDRDYRIVSNCIELTCESHDQAWNFLHEARDIVRAALTLQEQV